jgi:hypothetical protein
VEKYQNIKASTIEWVLMSLNTINHDLMKSAQNYKIIGSRLNDGGCRIEVKRMEVI